MAVVIGAGSTVTSTQFIGGITSVSFGFQPQVQRLFQLGSFSPYDTFVQKTRTLQLSVFGRKANGSGGSNTYSVLPSTDCTDTGAVSITVNPASCLGGLLPFTENFYLNSYSYQKDTLGYGQESRSFTSKPILDSFTGNISMIRGIAEGTIATGQGTMTAADMGVVIDEVGSNDAFGANIEGETGNIPSGTPGLGNVEVTRFIVATTVGGSTGFANAIQGLTGNVSVSVPLTPVFF